MRIKTDVNGTIGWMTLFDL